MRVQFRTRVPPQCPRKSSVHEGLDDRRWRSAAVVPAQKLGWREASSSMKIAVALLAATEARNRKLVAQMPSILCACLSALGTRVALSECRTPAGTYCHSSAGPTARSTTSERRPCCSASKRQCSRRPPGSRVWARAGMASWQAFGGGGGGGQQPVRRMPSHTSFSRPDGATHSRHLSLSGSILVEAAAVVFRIADVFAGALGEHRAAGEFTARRRRRRRRRRWRRRRWP